MLCEVSHSSCDFKMDIDLFSINPFEDMDYMTDYCFKSDNDVLHDCMWSGSCDKDTVTKNGKQCSPSFNSFNHHWNNGKLHDTSMLLNSPLLTSCHFFDSSVAEEENSLGEVDDYEDEDDLLAQLSNDSSLDEINTLSASNSLINDHSYGKLL